MAHSWRAGRRPLAILLAAGLASIAPEAGAIVLGDPEVRSALGETLDLRIPVTVGRGESIEPSCFALARVGAAEIPRLGEAAISLERSAQGTRLRVRSATPVSEPALLLGIIATCPGQTSEYQRDYAILLDPRPTAPVPVPVAASAPRSIAATLIARIGDTLASIANAIFPRNRSAKKTYIDALRETNPPLAALADNDPIPVDTPIALPDLRTFARVRPPSGTQVASAPRRAEIAASRESAPRRPARAERRVAAAPRERSMAAPVTEPRIREERRAVAAAPPAQRTARARSPDFQLKLSSGEVDLTRSRAIDDRSRARLRDRQLVLDVDDQVAAVLALRNSVKQLESRVAELQLKLAAMPASLAAARVEPSAPAPKAAEPPRPATIAAPKPAAVEPPKAVPVEPPKAVPVEPPKAVPVEPPKVAPVESPKVAPVETRAPGPAPKASPVAPPAAAPVPPSPARPEPPAAARVAAAPARTDGEESLWRAYGLWALLGLVVVALLVLLWGLARRRGQQIEGEEDLAEVPVVVAEETERREPVMAPGSAPTAGERRAMASDASLATRLPDKGGAEDLRRRYIEERFPEIVNRTIVLDDPESVIKGARLFYEDGAIARAVELLQFAIERQPAEIKTWLALFEIFRLERLSGEFAELAARFKQHHGKSDYWRKVQFFGREIDPANELYRDESFKSFETIGPAGARRIAEEASFDPIAENWLKAPMDFENEVLANDLRKALMAQAGINERDLAPNPMPALRNVEMFTVA